MSVLRNLNWFGKILVFVLFAAVVCIPTYFLGGFDGILKDKTDNGGIEVDVTGDKGSSGTGDLTGDNSKIVENGSDKIVSDNEGTSGGKDNTVRISLDEWIGWDTALIANGGLTTKEGSINEGLGISVEYIIINDADLSSKALMSGDIQGAGYTVNRLAFLYPQFEEAGVEVVMPFITNFSSGGDGIIARGDINSVEDLVGKKVGYPKLSEAYTMLIWLIDQSSLTEEQKSKIEFVEFDTPDEAAVAFFSGRVDAAATWQPYLSQAKDTPDSRVLFDTSVATNLILDGISFRRDFYENNQEFMSKYIEGILLAMDQYKTNFDPIRESMPMFALSTDDEILEMTEDADLANFATNKELLNGTAKKVFLDMSDIWMDAGEKASPGKVNDIFDSRALLTLSDKFLTEKKQEIKFTEDERDKAVQQENYQALLSNTLTINFEPNLAIIKEDSYAALDEFADTAKILNGAIMQIEGNIADTGAGDTPEGRELSLQRAKAVGSYLQMQGVEPSRFVFVGNGITKPVDGLDPRSSEGMAANRRTDIFFKRVE